MNPISKTAIAIVAVALIIVVGLIAMKVMIKPVENTIAAPTVTPTAEATNTPSPEPTQAPEEEAQDEAQVEGEMYEGALAGLTEEEIGRLAMAEEQGHSGETGEEEAGEEGAEDTSIAGVAD